MTSLPFAQIGAESFNRRLSKWPLATPQGGPVTANLGGREAEAGELTIFSWPDGPFEAAVFMVWHKEKWLTPTLGAFVETVRRKMAERSGGE